MFKRILYIDLDIHHGDAVQQAFYYSNNVFTLSFHRLDLGFYPGSGLIDEIGCGKGKGFCKNVPLKPGLSSRLYIEIFHEIFNKINMTFNPDLLVVQCGADGLAKDKKVPKPDAWNLDASAFVEIILHLKQTGIPILVLGGGGYNHVNTAKTWALMTMALDGADVPDMIPDNDPFIEEYAPDFSFDLEVSYRIDENLKVVDGKRYIDGIVDGVLLES